MAPLAATEDMYRDKWNQSRIGWKAIAVPGELHGLRMAFEKFGSGKVEWRHLLKPTIDLLVEGEKETLKIWKKKFFEFCWKLRIIENETFRGFSMLKIVIFSQKNRKTHLKMTKLKIFWCPVNLHISGFRHYLTVSIGFPIVFMLKIVFFSSNNHYSIKKSLKNHDFQIFVNRHKTRVDLRDPKNFDFQDFFLFFGLKNSFQT